MIRHFNLSQPFKAYYLTLTLFSTVKPQRMSPSTLQINPEHSSEAAVCTLPKVKKVGHNVQTSGEIFSFIDDCMQCNATNAYL